MPPEPSVAAADNVQVFEPAPFADVYVTLLGSAVDTVKPKASSLVLGVWLCTEYCTDSPDVTGWGAAVRAVTATSLRPLRRLSVVVACVASVIGDAEDARM